MGLSYAPECDLIIHLKLHSLVSRGFIMDQLRRYAIFAAVVEAGSMTGAAKALGMTPSAVSQHISQLESQLGLPLLHRSTRRLSLTEAGRWCGRAASRCSRP